MSIRPSHGARQRFISASTHGVPCGCLGIRWLHCRIGNASCSAAIARSAVRFELNGPRYPAPSSRTCLTSDNRGNGSTVTFSQCCRSGNFERRLYRGLCSAISRSSRTSASSAVPHSMPRTEEAMPIISPIRDRVSAAVKYDRTRTRRSFDFPTYSTSPRSSVNRYTPGACGSISARCRLARCAGETRAEYVCRSSSVCTPMLPIRSNDALCATSTQLRANSRNAGSTPAIPGEVATIVSVMPVSTAMNGGIGSCGLTSVWNSPSSSPPRTFTAPISVIADTPGAPPVVSRSTTQNVTSRSGVPSSSKLGWTPRIAAGRADSAVAVGVVLLMSCDVRAALRHSGLRRAVPHVVRRIPRSSAETASHRRMRRRPRLPVWPSPRCPVPCRLFRSRCGSGCSRWRRGRWGRCRPRTCRRRCGGSRASRRPGGPSCPPRCSGRRSTPTTTSGSWSRSRSGRRTASSASRQTREKLRAQIAELKQENTVLRRKLNESRQRVAAGEAEVARRTEHVETADARVAAARAEADREVRRLKARVAGQERELASVRLRLLLDTVLDAAGGLRRELALPPPGTLRPADTVASLEPESAPPGRVAPADDPALLDELLALPQVHLIVDGYNVTKTAWPSMPLHSQRQRLVTALGALVAQRRTEVTVVFDGAELSGPVKLNQPRGVRVRFSPPGVIADDVIRQLVRAEPAGRPVVVVSSDREVSESVAAAGARPVSASSLLARLP